jgi:hypothetical protein
VAPQVNWTVATREAETETDWLVCDWEEQTCTGTTDKPEHVGVYDIKMRVTDAYQGSVNSSFTLNVTNSQPRAVANILDITQSVNTFFETRVGSEYFTDADITTSLQELTYSIAMLDADETIPQFLQIQNFGSSLNIKGTSPDLGVTELQVTADDGFGGSASSR